jgi:hypothetical protein
MAVSTNVFHFELNISRFFSNNTTLNGFLVPTKENSWLLRLFFLCFTISVDSQPFHFKNVILFHFVKFKINIVKNFKAQNLEH